MAGEMIFLLAFVVFIAVYGIWKYSKAETNDYNTFVAKAQDLEVRVKELEGALDEVHDLREAIDDFATKVAAFDTEVSNAQEHNAQLRESVIELRDRLSKRTIKFEPTGPIQVEITSKAPQYPAPGKKSADEVKAEQKRIRDSKMSTKPPSPALVKKVKKQLKDLEK
jgi:hypothetical protein